MIYDLHDRNENEETKEEKDSAKKIKDAYEIETVYVG